ncbi:hypothetical protein D3227_32670 [Mesorhizobium waimense]|uniref:Uncharacterized protein n=1 Tax=Mesorhizobium waimense TaxID=1300307 RepID=A0A3A5K1L7_9HYPH|nr:hypothetical protein [Mesorhizobium waimense]RJT29226.1 hypothetical protein D3227_32670 [Mesorhizobium waimense]
MDEIGGSGRLVLDDQGAVCILVNEQLGGVVFLAVDRDREEVIPAQAKGNLLIGRCNAFDYDPPAASLMRSDTSE